MTRLSKLSGGEGSQPLDKCLFSFIVAGIQNKVNFPFPTPPPPGKKKPNTWFASSVGSWHKCDRKRSRDSVSAVKGSITIMSRETVLAVKYLIVLQKLRRLKNFNRLFLYRKAGFVLLKYEGILKFCFEWEKLQSFKKKNPWYFLEFN